MTKEPEPTHCALVREATTGSAAAVATLMRRHLPGLAAFIRLRAGARLRRKDSTDDLVMSACREVLNDLSRAPVDDERGFRFWLYRAAERKIAERARHHARKRRDLDREAVADEREVGLYQAYARICSPSSLAVARETMERIERAFSDLPDRHREIILLSRLVGFTHREIGEQLGMSEGAARGLLHRALARLAARIGPEPL